ncbi:uncharacterized protein [Panulirus ornatus]
MVTHDIVAVPKMKKIKMKKIKNKKAKRKKNKKGPEKQDSESDGDNLDLNQKLYPLLHYVSDQEELVNQMFTTIRGSKLEAMLPPVLKGIPLKELKKLCLHELRGMSKKRILCCINGQVMEGSSGSDEDDDEEKEDKEKATNEGAKNEENNTKGDKRKLSSEQIPKDFLQKKIKVEPGLEDSTEGGLGSDAGKSVLELLELEMRARIIKTMLEKGDDGKKIAEDAIAAVMQSAKQITKEDNQLRSEKETAAKAESKKAVESDLKGDLLLKTSLEEAISETGRGDKSNGSRDGKTSHRSHRSRDSDTRKDSRRRVRDKREKSYSGDSNCGEYKKRSKDGINSERHVQKKKKITRKEFEERMKRAKKNRTYRQRKTSEDEDKAKGLEMQKDQAGEPNIEQENDDLKLNRNDDLDSKKEDNAEGEAEEATGEVSEKEEGELDSNEEEEGACTPSNISSASNYSSSPSSRRKSYSSRSRSRSYSRSLSRSPVSRRRRRRRWRRRSYTRSRSRSRSVDWKSRDEGKRSYERKSREQMRNDNMGKRGNLKVPPGNQKQNKEEEENWGQKCDIEFVDSEEDFDDHLETSKKEMLDKKLASAAKGQVLERASISFSLQKKSAPNITPNIDLDDLPLKQSQVNSSVIDNLSSGIRVIGTLKPSKEEEIVISSDSEREIQEKVPVTTASSRHKNVLSEHKQADTKQIDPPVNKRETTESQVKVVKTLGDPEDETDDLVLECHTETKGHPIKKSEPLKELNNDNSFEQVSCNRKEAQKQDEIKAAIEKDEDITNSTCPTTVKESETCQVDDMNDVKDEIGNRDNLGFDMQDENYAEISQSDDNDIEKPQQSNDVENLQQRDDTGAKKQQSDDVEQNSSSDIQFPAVSVNVICVDTSEKEVFSDSDDKLDKFDDSETTGKDCVVTENKLQEKVPLSTDCCSSETEPGLSCKEVDDDSEENNHILVENLKDIDKEVTPAINERASQEESDIPCKDFTRVEGNKDVINDSAESFEEEITLKVKEKSVEIAEEEGVQIKEISHAQENEEKYIEQEQEIDSLTEDCVGRAQKVMEVDDNDSIATEEYLLKKRKMIVGREQKFQERSADSEGTNASSVGGEEPSEDFYKGAEQLAFSDDDKDDDCNIEEYIKDSSPVEPIRIETGLIRKSVLRQRKMEMVMPDKSWMKKEKKKKEKSKDTLVIEGIGLLTSTLNESVLGSSLKESEGKTIMVDKPTDESVLGSSLKESEGETMKVCKPFNKSVLGSSLKENEGETMKVCKPINENILGSSLKESEGEPLKVNKPSTGMETLNTSISSASETDCSLLAEDMTSTTSNQQSLRFGLEQETNIPASEETVSYEDYEPKSDEKFQKKASQETEIIGVIETSKDSGSDNFDDFELEGSSWSMRWLQSEKVQKVVTSSKMLSRVRKKIQKKDKATKIVTAEKIEEPQKKTAEPLVPIIGSIEEYERLFGMKVKKDKDEASNSSSTSLQGAIGPGEQCSQSSAAPEKVPSSSTAVPIFGSDDEGEDSEEEALWSKILGK